MNKLANDFIFMLLILAIVIFAGFIGTVLVMIRMLGVLT